MLHFLLNLVLCWTYCEKRVLFPDALYCQQNDLWTKEKYWAFWTLVFLIFGVKKDGRFSLYFRVCFCSAAGFSAPSYQWECSTTAIGLGFHWAWGVQSLSARTSLALHSKSLIWIVPNSSWNSLTPIHQALHALAPGWQSFFPLLCWGQRELGCNMPCFANPVRLRRSSGAVAAAGALQSPEPAPNSAVLDEREQNTTFGHFLRYHLL